MDSPGVTFGDCLAGAGLGKLGTFSIRDFADLRPKNRHFCSFFADLGPE
jgi:hypothetical protein